MSQATIDMQRERRIEDRERMRISSLNREAARRRQDAELEEKLRRRQKEMFEDWDDDEKIEIGREWFYADRWVIPYVLITDFAALDGGNKGNKHVIASSRRIYATSIVRMTRGESSKQNRKSSSRNKWKNWLNLKPNKKLVVF